MRIISEKNLKEFYTKNPDVETAIKTWKQLIKAAEWESANDVGNTFSKARPIKNNRIVFGLNKNDYRLIVRVSYDRKTVWVVFIGSHSDYDKIDPENV